LIPNITRFALLGSVEADSDAASIQAFDPQGRKRIVIGTTRSGWANIELADTNGVFRLLLTAFREAWMSIDDSSDRMIWEAGIRKGLTLDDLIKQPRSQEP
jgi:hypothetical protein